jgi:hypothetical protein
MLLALSACGDTASGPDYRAYGNLAAEIGASSAQHSATMGVATASACPGEMARYAGEMRPMVARMLQMSIDMDACMLEMGHADQADMRSTCVQMSSDLEQHLPVGCTASDPAAEASRHAGAMGQMAQHEADRADTMGGMMAGGGMMGNACRK